MSATIRPAKRQHKRLLTHNRSVSAYDAGMLDINRIRVFRAVVANGSVHGAAAQLGYTPSTVSQHITALQRETGLTLYEKAGRGIVPTATGLLLAGESDDLMAALAKLTGMVDDLRAGHTGRIEISAFASAAQSWVPRVARTLREEFPGLVVDLTLNEVWSDPGTPTADLDLRTEIPFEPPTSLPGYHRHALHEEEYVAVVPADHAAALRGRVRFGELATEPWIKDDQVGSRCTRILEQATAAAGFSPRYVARSHDHHTAMAFAAAGVGVCVIPRLASRSAPVGTVAVPIDEAPRRRVVVFVRDTSHSRPATRRSLRLLQGAAREAAD